MGKRLLALTVTALSVGCTVHQMDTPSVTGPSEFALSIRMAAVPDSISQDGASQSAIVVTAFDSNGRPCANLPVRMEMAVSGQIQDYGTLSARTIVTGTDGSATSVYTAPPAPPPYVGGSGTTVIILATPSTSRPCNATNNPPVGNFDASNRSQVSLRLVPPGVILPPAGSPTPSFFMTPLLAIANRQVTFDASASAPGFGASQITSYSWNFGDGTGGDVGRTVNHTFRSEGTFAVTLTVTNDRQLSASASAAISVGPPPTQTPPGANFTFSPTSPLVNDVVIFDSSSTTVEQGLSVLEVAWNFGDDSPIVTCPGGPPTDCPGPTNRISTHRFTRTGSFVVNLVVKDNAGLTGQKSTAITIGSGNPTPLITFQPGSPRVGDVVSFDSIGTGTFSGATITSYNWQFTGGILNSANNGATAQAHWNVIGTFLVRLTVVDSLGRAGTTTVNVTIAP